MFKRFFYQEKVLNYFVFSSTIIFTIILILFAYSANLKVGHWPSYSDPDPKTIDLDFYHGLVYCCFYLVTTVTISRLIVTHFQKINFYLIFGFLFLSGILSFLVLPADGGKALIISSVVFCFLTSVSLFFYGLTSLKKRGFDLSCLVMSCSLLLFWGHNILDPFHLIEWLLD